MLEDHIRSLPFNRRELIKLLEHAKGGFEECCITITPSPNDDDLLNSNVQHSSRPVAYRWLAHNLSRTHGYDYQMIMNELEFLEQHYRDEPKDFDETLQRLRN